MKKIRCGDEVIILTGRDKGKIATVKQFESDDQVFVQGSTLLRSMLSPILTRV